MKNIFFFFFFFLSAKFCLGQLISNSGIELWLIGDSVQLSTGTNINKCFDLSSKSNHATQLTSTSQPLSISSSINGHKTILFDGNDDFLQFNEISNIRTVFWVVKENNLNAPNYRPLLGHTTAYDFHRGNGALIWESINANPNVTGGITKFNFSQINGTTSSLNTQYSVVSLVTTNNVKANNFSNDRIVFGRLWTGELVELIIYSQALTSVQVDSIEQYLNNKYAPPILLPADIIVLNSYCDTLIKPINPNNNQYILQQIPVVTKLQ